MSRNAVKPGLTRKPAKRSKRAKRTVENDQFDAFVRRILAAYARRVAAGDIEALRSLAVLSSEVDAVTRLAVAGLRKSPYRYSWQEIADRLGTSRQAAQMRYGDPTDRPGSAGGGAINGGGLDRRLVEAGLSVTVATLVEVFADHHPVRTDGSVASVCPGCGYRYPDRVTDCPTLATVRPVLYRRRVEDGQAIAQLTPDQYADLHGRTNARTKRVAVRLAAQPTPSPYGVMPALFDLTGGQASGHATGGGD
jgi:hypothetical protein